MCLGTLLHPLSKDMGWKSEGSTYFPALSTGIILAYFYSACTCTRSRDLENKVTRYLEHHSANQNRNSLGRLSGPIAFLAFRFRRRFKTPPWEIPISGIRIIPSDEPNGYVISTKHFFLMGHRVPHSNLLHQKIPKHHYPSFCPYHTLGVVLVVTNFVMWGVSSLCDDYVMWKPHSLHHMSYQSWWSTADGACNNGRHERLGDRHTAFLKVCLL